MATNFLSEAHSPSGLGGGFFGCHRLGHNDGLLVMGSRPLAEWRPSFPLDRGESAGWFLGGQVCRAENHQISELNLNSCLCLGAREMLPLQLSPAPGPQAGEGQKAKLLPLQNSRRGAWRGPELLMFVGLSSQDEILICRGKALKTPFIAGTCTWDRPTARLLPSVGNAVVAFLCTHRKSRRCPGYRFSGWSGAELGCSSREGWACLVHCWCQSPRDGVSVGGS